MIKKLLKKTASTKTKKSANKKTTAKKTARKTTRAKKVSQDEMNFMIQELAYKYFEERGQSHGDDANDWYRAEQEIRKKYKV